MIAVDLFAGVGGLTCGATMAGVRVVWAGNHWQLAVDAHALNYPNTIHVCQDLRQANWCSLPSFGMLIGSPSCQPHSSASQGNRGPHHDAGRATAWAIVDCADATRPKAIVVENVPTFRRWVLYPIWRTALETLGYRLTELVLDASRHGVPQRRKRLFVVGLLNGKALHFASPLRPEVPFETCLEDPDPGGWKLIAHAKPGARDRIRAAQVRTGSRCLVQHVTGHPGVPLHEAIRTITTHEHWVLALGDAFRNLTPRELMRGMSFPDSYLLPEASRRQQTILIGNAVPPLLGRDVIQAVAEAA